MATPSLPLPFGSADARWLHVVLTELSRRSIDITCVSSTEEPPERVEEANRLADVAGYSFVHIPLVTDPVRLRRRLANFRRPFSDRARDSNLGAALEHELGQGYDVFHVEHLFNAWLALARPRSVVYLHNLEIVDWELRTELSLVERRTLFQMRRATRRLLRTAPKVIACTPRVAAEVGRWRRDDVPVVPLGLETTLYPWAEPRPEPVVGIIGSMFWWPSRSAAERLLDLWPAIHEQVPDARLLVAGWEARRRLGGRFPLAGAELVDDVQDPATFFRELALLCYPTPRGSGMKVKVLEALAYGIPVVTNDDGVEGMDAAAENGVVVARSDQEFVENVVSLLNDPGARHQRSLQGRRYVERSFNPSDTVDRLLAAYQRLGL